MQTKLPATRPIRVAVVWALALELAFAVATIVVIRLTAPWATTYSGASIPAAAADLAAGLGLILAGTSIRLAGRNGTAGVVATLAGVAWLGSDWIGWQDGPPIVRTIAMIVAPFFLPLMLHLVLGFPKGSVLGRPARRALLTAYGAVASITIGLMLVGDPLVDPDCWNNCTDNSLLLSSQPPLAAAFRFLRTLATLILGIALVGASAQRLARATSAGRRVIWPVMLPSVLLGASVAAYAAVLLRTPQEGTQISAFVTLFQARAWSAAAVAVGLAWTIARALGVRSSVARLATDLGATPSPGSLKTALARAMNDPSLEVSYWLPNAGRFVDEMGRTVAQPERQDGRSVTRIVRHGGTVAVVLHDATAADPAKLEEEIGAGARLAVDNERLQAELLAHLEDLRASRARIVTTGDAERVGLERNLHDGAQQRLLALLYGLRMAREKLPPAAEPELARLMDRAVDEALAVIAELRDVAHGIYPAILAESGLRAALLSLVDSAPLPVVLHEVTAKRFSSVIERTAYVVIAEAIDRAGSRGAEQVVVRVARIDDHLSVEVDGAGPAPFPGLADRAGAAGGYVTCDGITLRASLPCG